MRKVAAVQNNHSEIRRVILYETDEGVYLFPCSTEEDGSAIGDEWFESVSLAEQVCRDDYGILDEHWVEISDPLPDCQHDWIEPVRVKGRAEGKPEWGKLERLENGVWKEFNPKSKGNVG